jgi:hypothetical protein
LIDSLAAGDASGDREGNERQQRLVFHSVPFGSKALKQVNANGRQNL